jgi:hypothetical protein
MRKSLVSLASLIALSLIPAAAYAQGKGHGKGHEKYESAFHDRDRDHDRDRHRDNDHDRDDHRFKHNDRDDRASTGPSSRPPGWDKGKKTGWGNCDVPPGQAKKSGCNDRDRRIDRRRVDHHATRTWPHDRNVVHHPPRRRVPTTTTTASTTPPVGNPIPNNNRDRDGRPTRTPR